MNKSLLLASLSIVFAGSVFAQAPAPAAAPAMVHAVCKDGTPYSGETLKGACRGHGGVDKKASEAPKSVGEPPKTMPATEKATPAKSSDKAAKAPKEQAPGGGADKVWANDTSKVYHCPGDRYYGKTKQGEYMSEADAKTKGFHGARGKECVTK